MEKVKRFFNKHEKEILIGSIMFNLGVIYAWVIIYNEPNLGGVVGLDNVSTEILVQIPRMYTKDLFFKAGDITKAYGEILLGVSKEVKL